MDNDDTPTPVKKKKAWARWLPGGIAVVAIACGVLLATEANLRATIFQQKFTKYTFTNERGQKYSILFYRNAAVENYTSGTVNEKVLVSPIIKPSIEPVMMSLEGSYNNIKTADQESITTSKSCSFLPGFSKAFSVYLPSLKTTAGFCTDQGVVDVSVVSTSNSVYAIQFREKYNPATVTAAEAKEILDYKLSNSDLETISASFRPLS
jgi:hypothetical protein